MNKKRIVTAILFLMCLVNFSGCEEKQELNMHQEAKVQSEQLITEASENWNSLEVVKLMVSSLTPFTVLGIGFWINSRLKKLDHSQWVSQKVIERRVKIFDEMAPGLNKILCYLTHVGGWQKIPPDEMISLKRKLDSLAHVHASLFSMKFLSIYNNYIDKCYKINNGRGRDATLRTRYSYRKEYFGDKWDVAWIKYFVDDQKKLTDEEEKKYEKEIKASYDSLMNYFSEQLGILKPDNKKTKRR